MMSEHNHDHDHDRNCEDGCDCGHGHEEEATVTLTLDDGTVIECVILTIFPAGDKEYIALLPISEVESEESEVFLYRFTEKEDGQPELENIDDDDEYEVAAEAFDEFLDSAEFDGLDFEDDDEEE